MMHLLLALTANAATMNDDIDAVCAKPESLTVVIVSAGPSALTFNKIKSCKREGNRLTLVQGENDTIYVDLDDYGTIQIGHGRTTWLRLYS